MFINYDFLERENKGEKGHNTFLNDRLDKQKENLNIHISSFQ